MCKEVDEVNEAPARETPKPAVQEETPAPAPAPVKEEVAAPAPAPAQEETPAPVQEEVPAEEPKPESQEEPNRDFKAEAMAVVKQESYYSYESSTGYYTDSEEYYSSTK